VSDDYDRGWADGWRARSQAEDHSTLIDRLRRLKPQPGAFFLLGEIEREAAAGSSGTETPVEGCPADTRGDQ
jgi:hypothetical protein